MYDSESKQQNKRYNSEQPTSDYDQPAAATTLLVGRAAQLTTLTNTNSYRFFSWLCIKKQLLGVPILQHQTIDATVTRRHIVRVVSLLL